MNNENQEAKKHLSDYLYLLFKWKRFLLVNLLVVTALSVTFAFLLPLKYKSTATIMIPQDSGLNLGGLTSLIGGGKNSAASLGSKFFGVLGSSEDVFLGILNSRTSIVHMIGKFNLFDYYEISDSNIDKAIKAFTADIDFNVNEYGMIDISVINEDPKLSAEISNYFVVLLDSLNIKLNAEQARNNRLFIENRYNQNLRDLKAAEDSFYNFQRKYGIVAVPEQLQLAFKATAEIEAQLAAKEMSAFFTKQQYGENSPQYAGAKAEVDYLKKRVSELKSGDKISSLTNILYPFKQMPSMAMQYMRIYRELEIQSKILEFLLPMYEQAKVEEQKSLPTIVSIDKAYPPQLKDSPKRAFIIIAFLSIFFFIFVLFIYRSEMLANRTDLRNPLQSKEFSIAQKVAKLYKVNF
jgi:uncharacterized protein involved in exopolysaccharide biosynthesis